MTNATNGMRIEKSERVGVLSRGGWVRMTLTLWGYGAAFFVAFVLVFVLFGLSLPDVPSFIRNVFGPKLPALAVLSVSGGFALQHVSVSIEDLLDGDLRASIFAVATRMGLYLDEESESQFILSPVDSFTLGPLKIVPLPFLRVAVSVVDSTAVISGPRGKVIQLVQHLAEPTATGATVYPDG